MSDKLVNSLVANACRRSLGFFFEGYCHIQVKGGAIKEGAHMHEDQRKTEEIVSWCKANKKPCRIIKLKPRRGGSSTISVAALHWELTNEMKRGCILGGSDYQCGNLAKMLKIMADKDRTVDRRPKILERAARYPNGSTVDCVNGSNPHAGASGGYEFMIITELAKWAEEGVSAADEVLDTALKCVPYLPGTVVIIESTADGVGNEYHRRYEKAVTFEEFKGGKDGYIKIFSAWYEFSDYTKEPASETIFDLHSLTTEELDLVAKYGLSLPQVAWMRYAVRELCGGDFEDFRENYPFDDVDCFLLSGRKAFSKTGIKKLKEDLALHPCSLGVLDVIPGTRDKGVVWRPARQEDCRLLRWEQPIEGRRYLVVIDWMTGESQVVGDDPDNHSILVLRAAYLDDQAVFRAPAVVAQVVDDFELWMRERKYVLRWDPDVVVEQAYRVAQYFGNCCIVSEVNKDSGGTQKLHDLGCNMYVRRQWNKREQVESKMIGWQTTESTRRTAIGEMARGIREYAHFDDVSGWSRERFEIYSPIILGECDTFIIKKSGRTEAQEKKHDDCVLAASIGFTCIESATTYVRPVGANRAGRREDDDEGARREINAYS